MQPIRRAGIAVVLAFAGATFAAAQNRAQTETTSKITIKDGKEIKVTGCVSAPNTRDAGYLLTHVADKKGTLPDYTLVGKDGDDLEKHIGHRVEISGLAADRDGKVEVETKIKTKVEDGEDRERRTKATMTGDMPQMTYLRVKSLRMIAAVCP